MTTAIDTAMGTAKEAIGSATHAAKGAADHAAVAVKDTADEAAKTAKKIVSFLTHVDMDDVLGLVGLRRKRSPLAAIALLGGGVLVGAGLTLLFAPVSGRDARDQIRRLFGNLGTKAMQEAQEVKQDVQTRVGQVGEVVGDVREKVQEKVGEIVGQAGGQTGEGEGAQAQNDDTTGDERKGRRRHTNAQVS